MFIATAIICTHIYYLPLLFEYFRTSSAVQGVDHGNMKDHLQINKSLLYQWQDEQRNLYFCFVDILFGG